MPQSLAQIYVHLVFSTEGRIPCIHAPTDAGLHAYVAGTLQAIGSPSLIVGGMPDHLHILCRLSKTMAPTDVVKHAKVESSKWMKATGNVPAFAWQKGYGAFSVGASQVDDVIDYIRHQEQHHRKRTFQEEFREFLRLYRVAYDEAYVWD